MVLNLIYCWSEGWCIVGGEGNEVKIKTRCVCSRSSGAGEGGGGSKDDGHYCDVGSGAFLLTMAGNVQGSLFIIGHYGYLLRRTSLP